MQAWIISIFKDIPTGAVILFFVTVPTLISILGIVYRILLYARLRELSTWAWVAKTGQMVESELDNTYNDLNTKIEKWHEELKNELRQIISNERQIRQHYLTQIDQIFQDAKNAIELTKSQENILFDISVFNAQIYILASRLEEFVASLKNKHQTSKDLDWIIKIEESVSKSISKYNTLETQRQFKIVPKEVSLIIKSYEYAVSNLDEINTNAIIDYYFSQQKLLGISYEQIEYCCRIVPNFLISTGLLGTFFGITLNLSSIIRLLNLSNASATPELLTSLQGPLEAMGLAFISSLVALFLGLVVTFVNSIFNTALAKQRFIIAIEFYLENDLTIARKDPTSKIVSGMAAALDNFLLRFGETVKQAVQDSLGTEVEKMVAANKEASQLALEVNAKFLDASGNIVTGANTFQRATSALNDGRFSEKFSQASNNLVTAQSNLLQYTDSLNNLADKINDSMLASNKTNQEVLALSSMIRNLEYRMTQVLDAVDTNQTNFSHVAENLKQGARDFLAFKDALTDLLVQVRLTQANVNEKSVELANVQESLAKLTSFFDQSQKEITSGQASLSSAINSLVTEQQAIAQNLNSAVTATNDLNQSLERNRKENTDQLYTLFNESYKKITSTQDNFSAAVINLTQQHQTQLNTLKQGLEQILKLIKQSNDENKASKNNFDSTLTALERQISTLNSHIQRLERHHSTLANHSQTIGDGLSSANALLETLDTQAIHQTLQQLNTTLSNLN